MRRFRTITAAAVASVALAALLAGCSSASTSASTGTSTDCTTPTKLSIATTPYQDSLVMQLPQALGWYQQACLDVSFVNVSYSAIMNTIAGGQSANVAWDALDGVVTTYQQDPDLAYLYPWDAFTQGNAIIARADSGMKSVDDFTAQGMDEDAAIQAVVDQWAGKSVITTSNNVRSEILETLLNHQGKSADFMQKIDLAPDQGLAAYLQGTGDLYVAGIPQRATLVDQGYKVLISGPQIAAPSLNGYIVDKSLWEQNPDALLKLLNLTFMAIRYTDANLDEVANYISKEYQEQSGATFTADQFKQYWNKLELYPANAGEAQKMMFDPDGIGYWKKTFDQANFYATQIVKTATEPVPDSAFLGEDVQKAYVAKYGSDETGWWTPTGSLD